jgi:hypothetical protein
LSLGTLAPYAFPQALDDDGFPLDGGFLYTYAAGTSTPATTYTDADLLVPNTNPIVLSSPITTGYPLGPTFASCHAGTAIFPLDSAKLAPGTYKLQGMILSTLSVGIVGVALVNLTDGAPDTPIVEMFGSNAAGNVATSGPIVFAAGGTVKNYGIKAKIDTGSGFAWAIQLVKVV